MDAAKPGKENEMRIEVWADKPAIVLRRFSLTKDQSKSAPGLCNNPVWNAVCMLIVLRRLFATMRPKPLIYGCEIGTDQGECVRVVR